MDEALQEAMQNKNRTYLEGISGGKYEDHNEYKKKRGTVRRLEK
jgi:hypothetical protein